MAIKRMFSMRIVDSDAFLDMPLSSQALYFHLNMRADDDGFIGNAKRIITLIGAKEDDLRMLVGKKFLIPFNNGVFVIKHWKINNSIKQDRYTETSYTDEKSMLYMKSNKSYTLNSNGNIPLLGENIIQDVDIEPIEMETKCIQNGSKMVPEMETNWRQFGTTGLGLDLDIDKNSIDKKHICDSALQTAKEWYESVRKKYPKKRGKLTDKAIKAIYAEKDKFVVALDAYCNEVSAQHKDQQYILNESTFINGRWKDYYSEPDKEVIAEPQKNDKDDFAYNCFKAWGIEQ